MTFALQRGMGAIVTSHIDQNAASRAGPMRFPEFVTLVAALMALAALGIDAMLPALPAIGDSLNVTAENERQYVILIYLIGLGIGQLFHGPLSDRLGRRPVMLVSIALYIAANIAAAITMSFATMLLVRLAAALFVGAGRVVTIALVRDCYAGRPMARVMSFASMVFMAAPILAPMLGQALLLIGSWRLIFWFIAGFSAIVFLWFAARMPETLHPRDRSPLSVAQLAGGLRRTLSNRESLGYTLASAMIQAGLFGYISSIQQIMADTFARGDLLTLVFGTTAGTLAVANLLNAQLVLRVGSRRISHGALVALIILSMFSLWLSVNGNESLPVFATLIGLSVACFGLANSNFSAMAMTEMGAIAGTASSVQSFLILVIGAIGGAVIGQHFAGTTVPLHCGFLVAALVAFAVVAWVERGRLFRPA